MQSRRERTIFASAGSNPATAVMQSERFCGGITDEEIANSYWPAAAPSPGRLFRLPAEEKPNRCPKAMPNSFVAVRRPAHFTRLVERTPEASLWIWPGKHRLQPSQAFASEAHVLRVDTRTSAEIPAVKRTAQTGLHARSPNGARHRTAKGDADHVKPRNGRFVSGPADDGKPLRNPFSPTHHGFFLNIQAIGLLRNGQCGFCL